MFSMVYTEWNPESAFNKHCLHVFLTEANKVSGVLEGSGKTHG